MKAPAFHLPHPQESWYLALPSQKLRPGQVVPVECAGVPMTMFRGQSGKVAALPRHCPHMGGNLARGHVVGDCLQCPLHHWQFSGDGQCRQMPEAFGSLAASTRSWAVSERLGSIFVYPGEVPDAPLPPEMPQFSWVGGAPIWVEAPWYSLVANPFDVVHVQTIHQRRLLQPPQLDQPHPRTMRMRCLWEVTGQSPSDRMMRWLSGNRIQVEFTCYGGSLLLIRSDLGRVQSGLLVGLTGQGEGCWVQLVYGSRGGPLAARLCQWLYLSFLKRDLEVLEGAAFRPYTGLSCDEPLARFGKFLESLFPS